jgi:hypothetical protein
LYNSFFLKTNHLKHQQEVGKKSFTHGWCRACSSRTSFCAETTEKLNIVFLAEKIYFQENRFGLRMLDHTPALSSGDLYIVMIVVF